MTKHQVRELTPEGIAYARKFLNDAREHRVTQVPDDLLTDNRYAKPVKIECLIEKRTFHTRRDAGEYLDQVLEPLGVGNIDGNYQLWSWLGMFYFDTLVERDETDHFRLGRLPEQSFVINLDRLDLRKTLFNRLMLAWATYRYHGDRYAAWILDEPLMPMSRLVERIVNSRHRFASSGIVKLIGLLYIDPVTRRAQRGATANDAIGGIRRLNNILDQLYMTYDVYGMNAEQLLALLPEEFRRFHPQAGSARKR